MDCVALDAFINSFPLELAFATQEPFEIDKLVQVFKTGSIFWVRGAWMFAGEDEDATMIIYDPTYWPYRPEDLKKELSRCDVSRFAIHDYKKL